MKTKLVISAAVLLTLSSCSRVVEETTASLINSVSSVKKDMFKKLDKEIVLEIDRDKLSERAVIGQRDLKRCVKIISERLDLTSQYRFKVKQGENETISLMVSSSFDKTVLDRAISTDVLKFHKVKSSEHSNKYRSLLNSLDSICEIHYSQAENYDSSDLMDEELSELLGPVSTVAFEKMYFNLDEMDAVTEKLALPSVLEFLGNSKLIRGEFQVDRDKYGDMFRLYHVEKSPSMTGVEIESATSSQSTYMNDNYVVSITFSNKGAKEFARVTARCIGDQLAIVYGDVVLSAPMVNERITGGRAQISGDFDSNEAKELAAMISTGELPLPLKIR